ncbi:hypothetical protein BCR37DRAFT_388358 [Protomyces lactucae-debilis]|uniref:Uncharacterized protein n=1 Tax=Protomyces lactucae-debilis TaxID=2754530 RepID=A0A1Y2F7W3_PROLT|nr:uncharacterized protein BCR37DRAFT_388358 [Protomyces lactucae-debilis]ORY79988.1 hypothetical protein BCR37DRAFT_388358 [Protomyces lactucae-debilis]
MQLRCDTASCNDTFNHLASVLDLDQHTLLHDEELSYFSRRLWFVPLIDADSLLLNIESLEKYYIPGHYIRPLPLGAPGTRPMHCVNGWAEHTTRHYNDEHSEPGSYYSYEDLEDCFDSEEDDSDAEADGVGIIEVENESVEDGYSSADDPMSE